MNRFAQISPGIIFLLSVAGTALHFIKKFTLNFHTRDYQYYFNVFEFRWHSLFGESRRILLHPQGFNVLGFSGTDGYPTIETDIHFSPITYLLSLVKQIGGEPLVVLIFAMSVSTALTLLVDACLTSDSESQTKKKWLYAALTISAAKLISYDLRIWILLVPSALFLFFSIKRQSSTAKIILISIAVLSIREESYYFVLICAAYLAHHGRRSLSFLLAGFASVQLILSYFYFFQIKGFDFSMRASTLMFLLSPLIVFLLVQQNRFNKDQVIKFLKEKVRNTFGYSKLNYETKLSYETSFLYLWLGLLLSPLLVNLVLTKRFHDLFLDDRYFFLAAFLCIVVVQFAKFRKPSNRHAALFVLFAVGLVAATPLVKTFVATDIHIAKNVWKLSEIIPVDTRFITSLKLQQAFLTHSGNVFQRLPAVSSNDVDRFWPNNQQRLVEIIRDSRLAIFLTSDSAPLELFKNEGFSCVTNNSLILCDKPENNL